jgi:importin subunit alpha-1
MQIQISVLRVIGNMVAGNALQTQKVIDAGVLNYLHKTMFNEKRAVRKETCWIISNIAAGTQQQIEALILNNFLPVMTRVVKNDDPEVRVIYNLDSKGSNLGDL